MTVINSNSSALRAQNGSRIANMQLDTAMARLSSGKRINTASDDAAGLAISNSMTSQITGMNQAIRNSNDGISLAQTADGALDEVTNMAQRIRELAVQSASGTYSADDRANMQAEVSQLSSQISSTLSDTKFNNVALFDTTVKGTSPTGVIGTPGYGTRTAIQIGANSGNTVNIDIGNLDATSIVGTATTTTTHAGALTTHAAGSYTVTQADFDHSGSNNGTAFVQSDVGTTVTLNATNQVWDANGGPATTSSSTSGGVDVSSISGANSAMTSVDSFLKTVNTVRAGLGAAESRMNSVVNSLTDNVTNLTDARSRIADADFSVETTNLAKAQILSQAATAMLAQANQTPQGVMKLLQG